MFSARLSRVLFLQFTASSVIVLLFLFVPLTHASSYRWKLVAYDDSAKYFINMDYIERSSGTISFWVKSQYSNGELTSIRYKIFCRDFEFRTERSMTYENKQSYKKDISLSERNLITKSPLMLKCFELFCGEKTETYYPNGMLRERGWIYRPADTKDEIKVGRWTYWHDNGVKSEDLFFKNERKEGVWTFWNRDGKQWKQQHYKNDLLDGLWTAWHPNGKKSIERNYVNGSLDGKSTRWNEHGRVIKETWYKSGKPVNLPQKR